MKRLGLVLAITLAAACGKVLEVPTDGGGDDANVDGPPDVAVRGTVRVTVLDRNGSGAVVVGIPVVFVDPDGTIVATVATDSNGRAQADILPGGSVTSVATVANGKQMSTVLAIAPGDDVVIGRTDPDLTVARTFVVNWTQLGGANDYTVYGPCGFQNSVGAGITTATITLRNSCNPATMELLVQARNTSNVTIGFSSKSNITVADGSTTMPAFTSNVSFTGSFTNVTRTTNLTMTRRVPLGFGFNNSLTQDMTEITSTTLSTTVPSVATARVDTNLQGTMGDSQEIQQKLAGTSTTYGLDVAAVALPWIDAPVLDTAARTIAISADNTGTSGDAPDLVQTVLSWRRGGNTSYGWVVFGPAFETITLPNLPDELADGLPLPTDVITGNRVKAYDADTIDGYPALRATIGAALIEILDNAPFSTASLVRTSTSIPGT